MELNLFVFVVLGSVLWLSYKLLASGSGWFSRLDTGRKQAQFLEIAARELGVEPVLSAQEQVRTGVLLHARLRDTVVRVTEHHAYDDFGTGAEWHVDIEDPAFDAPRDELPAIAESLRNTGVLPEELSLEPGKLSYKEPPGSPQAVVDRVRKLLALLDSPE